jgi:hypothetical protein
MSLTKRHGVVLLVWLILAGIQPLAGQRATRTKAPAKNPPAKGAVTATAPQPLAVRAWLDADQVVEGGEVRVWVVIDNRNNEDVDEIRFDALQLHGFDRVAGCWTGNTPACAPDTTTPVATNSIPALGQLTRWAVFKRVQAENGRASMFGSLHGRMTRGARAEVQTAISVGPIQLSSAARPISLVIVTLMGAIIAAVVAAVTQLMVQYRNERNALLTAVLPKNLKNAERYYLPLQTGAERLTLEATKHRKGVDNTEALLFYWLQFDRRIREMQHNVGGFYFQFLSGEVVAGQAQDGYKGLELNLKGLDSNVLNRVIGQVDQKTNPGDFATLVEENAAQNGTLKTDLASMRDTVKRWLGRNDGQEQWSGELALKYLEVYTTVLGIEINRPHDRWYGEKTLVDRRQFSEFADEFRGWGDKLGAEAAKLDQGDIQNKAPLESAARRAREMAGAIDEYLRRLGRRRLKRGKAASVAVSGSRV